MKAKKKTRSTHEARVYSAGALALNSLELPARKRVLSAWIGAFPEAVPSEQALAKSYSMQLDQIGATLVRAGFITKGAVARDGVHFALLCAFDSLKPDVRYARRAARIAKKTMVKSP